MKISWLALAIALVLWAQGAHAQVSCTVKTEAQLLASFSDNASAGSITPATVRDFICTVLGTPGTSRAAALVVGSSPTVFVASNVGTLFIDSGSVEISRDAGSTWFSVGLAGGQVPVLVGDRVRVSWFGAYAPNVSYFVSF